MARIVIRVRHGRPPVASRVGCGSWKNRPRRAAQPPHASTPASGTGGSRRRAGSTHRGRARISPPARRAPPRTRTRSRCQTRPGQSAPGGCRTRGRVERARGTPSTGLCLPRRHGGQAGGRGRHARTAPAGAGLPRRSLYALALQARRPHVHDDRDAAVKRQAPGLRPRARARAATTSVAGRDGPAGDQHRPGRPATWSPVRHSRHPRGPGPHPLTPGRATDVSEPPRALSPGPKPVRPRHRAGPAARGEPPRVRRPAAYAANTRAGRRRQNVVTWSNGRPAPHTGVLVSRGSRGSGTVLQNETLAGRRVADAGTSARPSSRARTTTVQYGPTEPATARLRDPRVGDRRRLTSAPVPSRLPVRLVTYPGESGARRLRAPGFISNAETGGRERPDSTSRHGP